nr:hypothetical protein [uncultured Oscillibacter sp.]
MNEERAQELLNTLVNDMVEKSGRQIYSVVQTLFDLGFTRHDLLALSFRESDISRESPGIGSPCRGTPALEQQRTALAEIAAKLDVAVTQVDYQEKLDARNTALFYLKEDYEYNKKADQRSGPQSIPVLMESGALKTVQGYVRCVPFWTFENSDVNGRVSYDFANHGQIDLRDSRWKEALEGHVRFALAERRQLRHMGQSGGWGALREADDVYNDLNRQMIEAMKLMHGTAFLGNVNFHGEDHKLVALGEKSVYEEYTGQPLYNFCCSFCVPTADRKLEELIRAWNADDTLPQNRVKVDEIMDRIKAVGGINLIWY